MFPHHSGLKNESQPLYGQHANQITSHLDYDEIAHNSILRYVKCCMEKNGEEQPHCFVANERHDPIAKEAFDRLTSFWKEKTEEK